MKPIMHIKTLFINQIMAPIGAIDCFLGRARVIIKCDIEQIRTLFNESENTDASFEDINTLIDEDTISLSVNVALINKYNEYEIVYISNVTVKSNHFLGRPPWARLLSEITEEPTKKFPFLIKDTVFHLSEGRLNALFAVSGSGKTYYSTKNASYYLHNKIFDLIIYVNLELPTGELKARFSQSSRDNELVQDKILILDKRDVKINELLNVLEAERLDKKKIFIVIDNGDNILLNIKDTARTGLRQFANELHNWLASNIDCSALWLGQVDRDGIGELFDRQGKFIMGLQHTKTSSGVYEIAHTVIGMAQKEVGRYDSIHSKALKNGGNT